MHQSGRRIIAFDLDDTLYNERDYVCQALSHVANHYATTTGLNDRYLLQSMLVAPNPFNALSDILPAGAVKLDDFIKLYRSVNLHPLPLRSDAARLVQCLHDTRPDIPLYIITDGQYDRQMAKFIALGLDEFIDPSHLLVSSQYGDKLSGKPFDCIMQAEGDKCQCIYIGDNPAKDFYQANLRGWHTIMTADKGMNVHPQDLANCPSPQYYPKETVNTLDPLIIQLCQ